MSYSQIRVRCPNCKQLCEHMGFGSWFFCDDCNAGFDPFSKDEADRQPPKVEHER